MWKMIGQKKPVNTRHFFTQKLGILHLILWSTYAFIWAALESDVRFLSIGEPIPIGGGIPGPDLPIPVKHQQQTQ